MTAFWLWAGFILFVLLFVVADLVIFHRRGQVISMRTALIWTALCVGLAALFVPILYVIYENHYFGMGAEHGRFAEIRGMRASAYFVQAFVMEKALSVDNLFVFALIFRHFAVPREHQHRVLTWGIIATLIMRGTMIGMAVEMIEKWHWLLYCAGAFLVYTAVKMYFTKEEHEFDPAKSKAVKAIRWLVPITSGYHGERFFARENGKLGATPLFLVLIVLNVVDVIFAVDSVPAVVGITQDPFLIFSSNMFAILGLRALYFVLAEAMDQFEYLKVSLIFVLAFVGCKMLVEGLYHLHKLETILPASMHGLTSWLPDHPLELNPLVSLGIILGALTAGIVASRMKIKPA
ncbi:MAG: TerC/Alx family metal homeostasis membrane protein [Phycisphaerales bacterium]